MPTRKHESSRHSVGEYVCGVAHVNGIESFWSMQHRSPKTSREHLHRYVAGYAGPHNVRPPDTTDQLCELAPRMVGRRLMIELLIADNGRPSGARTTNQAWNNLPINERLSRHTASFLISEILRS